MSGEPQPTLQEQFDAALTELTGKERLFVTEYLHDLHQRNAAIRAGYSERSADVTASRMLRNAKIRAAVDLGFQLKAMSAGEVIARLTEQARGSMADFLRIDDEEITLTWSLLNVPTTEDGALDMAGAMLRLAGQANVTPTDRILHTATITRPVARLDLMEAGRRGKLSLIKKYSLDDKGKVSIELYDAQAAQGLIGKYHKLFTDKIEHSGHIDVSKLSDDELRAIAES